MEEARRRILEDLRDAFAGEIRTDNVTTAMFSTDASLYEIEPIAVAFPKSTDDVRLLAEYSGQTETPLIARGAGTGLAGGAIGRGIIVDFTRHMNRIIATGEDSVRVQPGVIRSDLNRHLRSTGRYFAPDPANSGLTTIGGMLGVDAAGSHAVRVGSTRDHVESIECVLVGGDCVEFCAESIAPEHDRPTTSLPADPSDSGILRSRTDQRRRDLVSHMGELLMTHSAIIAKHQPMRMRNCCGYQLNGVRRQDLVDMPRLLVGSEGTLALFTEMTLHTIPVPEFRGVVLLCFPSLDDALQAVHCLLPLQPSACDLLDRRLLSLARAADARFEMLIPPQSEAVLILEHEGYSEDQVSRRLSDSVMKLNKDASVNVLLSHETTDPEHLEFFWSLPSLVVPLLSSLKGESRPLPFIEDIAVPPEAMSDFLHSVQRVFQKHEVTSSLHAHAASGQLHLRPFLPIPNATNGERFEALARDVYQQVFAAGGSISGEHGDGLSRTAFVRSQYGPLYRAFQQVKLAFDPHHLLNPGKIISDDPHLTRRYFRKQRSTTVSGETTSNDAAVAAGNGNAQLMQLTWHPDEAAATAAACNGCGTCRTDDVSLRMCPLYRTDPREFASPRSKGNLLRVALNGEGRNDLLVAPEIAELSRTCFNCKQCRIECPSSVDIPHLMLEARGAYVAANGLNRSDWLLSRIPGFARLASRFAFFSNRLLGNGMARRLLERTIGLAAKRRLPKFASRVFLKSPTARRLKPPTGAYSDSNVVLYFVDYFANYHDPLLAEAFVRILEHHDIRVVVPPDQKSCGMTMISVGDFEAARPIAEHNITQLADAAREGCRIVCTEPSAAVCLSEEYPLLLSHPDAPVVANQVFEAGRFLQELHEAGKLDTNFRPLNIDVAYHTPCHSRAVSPGDPFVSLLSLIPELRVNKIDRGCTGMGGLFGLSADNFETSQRIGREVMQSMRVADVVAGTTECSTCRMQLEQDAPVPTIHPLKLLAAAYGLLPELESQLRPSKNRYLIS